MKSRNSIKPFTKICHRLHDLKLTYAEIAPRLWLSKTSFNDKMQGRIPWQLHEAYRLVEIIGHPGDNENPPETIYDYFPENAILGGRVRHR